MIKRQKMMIIKIRKLGNKKEISFAVSRKGIDSDSILWMLRNIECTGDIEVIEVDWSRVISVWSKCLIKASQKAFIEDCPGVEFNEQSVEVVERFSFVNLVTQ